MLAAVCIEESNAIFAIMSVDPVVILNQDIRAYRGPKSAFGIRTQTPLSKNMEH